MEQNTLKIWDGTENSREERKKVGGWDGFHVLYTERTQFLIVWECAWKKMIIVFFAMLVFFLLLRIAVHSIPRVVLLSAVVAVLYGLWNRDGVYTKMFDPSRDQGKLYLPEGMTWDAAVDVIRRGFAEAAVEQITDTADTVVFHSKKFGAYQLQNTEDGLKLSILSTPSKEDEKMPRYFLFSNMIYSQVIALLYPQMLSVSEVEQEKKAFYSYMKQKNIKKLLGVAVFIIVIAAAAAWYFNLDSVKSCGVSDSEIDSFSADATIGEIFDAYFKDSKWDHYDQNGQTVVTYTGDKTLDNGTVKRFTFYFLINTDDTFNLDHITCNGADLGWLETTIILNTLDENYTGTGETASADATMPVESDKSTSDSEAWNTDDSGISESDDIGTTGDGLGYSAGQIQLINEAYGTVWPGWINGFNPDSPKYDDISYGMVMDVLLDGEGDWYFDTQTGNVGVDGVYTTFDYTMGMADEPTLCEVHLTFTMDDSENWIDSGFSGDEFDTAEDFLAAAYSWYYQSYCS